MKENYEIVMLVIMVIYFAYFELRIKFLKRDMENQYDKLIDKISIEKIWKDRLANIERKWMDLDEDLNLLYEHFNLILDERETLKEIKIKNSKKKNWLFKIASKMR